MAVAWLARGLAGVTAAVVGVIASISIWFAGQIWFAAHASLALGPFDISLPQWHSVDGFGFEPLRHRGYPADLARMGHPLGFADALALVSARSFFPLTAQLTLLFPAKYLKVAIIDMEPVQWW